MLERLLDRTSKALGIETREVTTSLDDYYRDKFGSYIRLSSHTGRSSVIYTVSEFLSWDKEKKQWKLVKEARVSEAGAEDVEEAHEEISGKAVAAKLNHVLLLQGELSDIQLKSPEEIQAFITNSVTEEVLMKRAERRLREWGPFPKTKTIVTGWQQEPTQAT